MKDNKHQSQNEWLGSVQSFYVDQHNHHLPQSAFKGQTPDEMYSGTGAEVTKKLEEQRVLARKRRLEKNRLLFYVRCVRSKNRESGILIWVIILAKICEKCKCPSFIPDKFSSEVVG